MVSRAGARKSVTPIEQGFAEQIEKAGVSPKTTQAILALFVKDDFEDPSRLRSEIKKLGLTETEIETISKVLQTNERRDVRALRVWELNGGMAQSAELSRRRPPLPEPFEVETSVTLKRLRNTLKEATTPASPAGAAPEDGSKRVKAFHMAAFGLDQTGLAYPKQMALIGLREGFHVVLRVPKGMEAEARKELKDAPNVKIVEVEAPSGNNWDFWSEDGCSIDVEGNFHLPAQMESLEKWQEQGLRARIARLYPNAAKDAMSMDFKKLMKRVENEFPLISFPMVGRVVESRASEGLAAAAIARKKKVYQQRSHIEGGNLLVGRNAKDEPYAIIGKDSLEQTRFALSPKKPSSVTDEEVMEAISKDLGIEKGNLIAVEQPGSFHIDMAMAMIGPGVVLLNDSVAAQRLDEKNSEENSLLGPDREFEREEAKRLGHFEGLVEAQLKEAGLKVVRVGGAWGTRFNFLNAEQGRSDAGDRYYISAGGPPFAEQAFIDALNAQGTDMKRVYFLDRPLTSRTLAADGSISCRSKAEIGE